MWSSLSVIDDSRSVFSFDTINSTLRFFERNWAQRDSMDEVERRGLGQLGYLVLAAHFEATIASAISGRLQVVITSLRQSGIQPPGMSTDTGPVQRGDPAVLFASLRGLLDNLLDGVGGEVFNGLEKRVGVVFHHTLKQVLGGDLHQTVKAVFGMRNVLAHGRPLSLPMSITEGQMIGPRLYTESNTPLLYQVLMGQGLVPADAEDATAHLFNDESLRFLFLQVSQAELKVAALRTDPVEQRTGTPLRVLPAL